MIRPHAVIHNPIRRRRKTTKTRVPFLFIVVLMVSAMTVMGMLSIYSMLYLTDTIDKPAPKRNLPKGLYSSPVSVVNLASKEDASNVLQSVRQEFATRYGGIEMAEAMLKRGINSFGSIDATAGRMIQAAIEERPFVMAFSGYSITVGRGNFFNQSFPFVAQRVLERPMQALLGTKLIVRNGAIGGIPSFPYGFCLEHFLGMDPDVVGWDYSMNEKSGDASVLEAFVRQATQQLPQRPMFVILDQNPVRTKLLQDYAQLGLLSDAIAVGKKEALDQSLFQRNPLPDGLQEWDEFGAPKQCPGRGSWHPKKKEHELIGWMIAMHFLSALERAHQVMMEEQEQGHPNALSYRDLKDKQKEPPVFPPPMTKPSQNDPEVTELLYGHRDDNNQFHMKDVSCRTSFLPATDHTKVIPSVVVSGIADKDLDIMKERQDSTYRQGWVLDVSKVERDTKIKVDRCGGLGYIDMKIALYGIPESGVLRLWLPFEKGSANRKSMTSHNHHDHSNMDDAQHWFDDLILCEANDKRPKEACQLNRDLEIFVGGVPVTSISPIRGAAEYLKRTTCVNVGVPNGARVSKLSQVRTSRGESISAETKRRLVQGSDGDQGNDDGDDAIGLVVDIQAKSKVTRADGACCISHIVWEQH